MGRPFFFLLLIFAAGFLGFWVGRGEPLLLIPKEASSEKEFAIVLYSHDAGEDALFSLQSILDQQYGSFRIFFFEDGASEETFQLVKAFCEEKELQDRIVLLRSEETVGLTGALYFVTRKLKGPEIVVPLEAKNRLGHPAVLQRLNLFYQDPNIWLSLSHPVLIPSYEVQRLFRRISKDLISSTPVTFYASLFHQIPLGDLVQEGRFLEEKGCYFSPLIQMCKGHRGLIDEPLFFIGNSYFAKKTAPSQVYEALQTLPEKVEIPTGVDFLIFTYNRPLQLYACLESMSRYFTGYEKLSVLCRADGERFRKGYSVVEKAFPHVQFIYQSQDPKHDFKSLLLKTLFSSSSPYIAFGVDDQIVTDFVDLKKCAEKMEETSAYGFYLRLGKEICYSYQGGKEQEVPPSVYLGEEVYSWNLKQGCTDWDFPHTLDMTIYRKKDVKKNFEKIRYKTPNSLEFAWAKRPCPEKALGLYFEHAKVVNIPLNVVGRTGNPHMNAYTVDELLNFFEEGKKIDISPLYQIANLSPHIEYDLPFIPREEL
ncbi:MAG TPA: hypothetical protein VJK48_00875 [Chlamydiales bacterium]|nr:hypothetical protein [Chlamydiales bacterium]